MTQEFYGYPHKPRVNLNGTIGDLNSVIISKLTAKLDRADPKKNWRALIDVIPDAPFSSLDVEHFANKKVENKSPSRALLTSLMGHGRTVQQLIGYLNRIDHEQALLVLQVPCEDVRVIQQPVDLTVEQGDESTAVFSCHGKGFPFPRYQWYKAGAEKSIMIPNANNRVLRISPVMPNDAGKYVCRLHNDRDGKVVSYLFTHWAELKVEVPPEYIMSTMEILKHPSSVTANVGNEIVLECEVKSQFTPRFQWYRMKSDGSDLSPAMIPGKNESKLVFMQVNVDDSGHYKCKIESGREKKWTYFAKVDIVPNNQDNIESKIPVIVRQPVSLDNVKINEVVVLACEAYAIGSLRYQWYKNGDRIPDETGSEYRIESMKPCFYGTYMCTVKNDNGEVQSKEASILPPLIDNPITALNKVALLIGNQSYRALTVLNTPKHEVHDLAITLDRDLNFQVITLIDLTKEEIQFSVQWFCSLLAKGMYGLFFFSGHGFENEGHSFLIPVDCTSGPKKQECVDAQWILDQMMPRETALNVILLDICRTSNDYKDENVEDLKPLVKGNTVFGYAAAANCQSFESESEKYSVFAKHLLKNITKRKRIEHVLEEVKKGVQDDPVSSQKQFPTVLSDLVENRGLCDPINSHGQTRLFDEKLQNWMDAHAIEFEFERQRIIYNYMVDIDVHVVTSNIMIILVYIVNDNNQRFQIQLSHFPPELDVSVRRKGYSPDGGMVFQTMVSGLQKLKEKLQPSLYIEYMDDWGKVHKWSKIVDFGTPLVSKIWQQNKYKQPMESAYPDYDQRDHQARGIHRLNPDIDLSHRLQEVTLSTLHQNEVRDSCITDERTERTMVVQV